MVKVTVYIPTYNYACYLSKAINSVIDQTMDSWELIIIDDGSTDNTQEILAKYKKNTKINILRQENKGLNATNNIALRLSQGEYIMRLDSDDYLDENALLLLSNILDTHPHVDLVYPDYYEIDQAGEIINLVRRKKIGEEVELLDLPAHGACTMFRKEVLKQIGGYFETFTRQDGYEIWLKFIRKHVPYNIHNPLFYYRKHPTSLTKKQNKLLETRREIKRNFVEKHLNNNIPKVLGIIPVNSKSVYHYGEPFQEIAGRPLLWYTLHESVKSRLLDRLIITSDDEAVLKYASQFPGIGLIQRPNYLSSSTTKMYEIVQFVLAELKNKDGYFPDAVCTLYINTPLRKAKHIDKAIDTLTIFNTDTVISIEEELAVCYQHCKYGLQPIEKSRTVRMEKKAIYKENSAIFLSKTDVFLKNKLIGECIGHITMLPEESVKINSTYELWLAEKTILGWSSCE